MATDMGVHKSIVEGLKARPAGEFDACNDQDKKDLLCAIVHAADLSGQTLPEGVAHKFGERPCTSTPCNIQNTDVVTPFCGVGSITSGLADLLTIPLLTEA
jgi:hypothetical protein